jgi:hypothetical protein
VAFGKGFSAKTLGRISLGMKNKAKIVVVIIPDFSHFTLNGAFLGAG